MVSPSSISKDVGVSVSFIGFPSNRNRSTCILKPWKKQKCSRLFPNFNNFYKVKIDILHSNFEINWYASIPIVLKMGTVKLLHCTTILSSATIIPRSHCFTICIVRIWVHAKNFKQVYEPQKLIIIVKELQNISKHFYIGNIQLVVNHSSKKD